VMLVSAQGGEATTTVATQFAAALARDPSLRVLLVDAHARRPLLTEWITTGSAQRRLFGGNRKPSGPAPDPATSERLPVLTLPQPSAVCPSCVCPLSTGGLRNPRPPDGSARARRLRSCSPPHSSCSGSGRRRRAP